MQLGKLDVSQSEPELSCKTVDIGVQDNQGVTSESQNSQLIANPTALALYEGVNACQNPDQLDAVARLIWERYGVGAVNDDEASYLASCIERRRPLSRRTSTGKFATIGKMNGRVSRFLPRPCRRRLSDDERRDRRSRKRMLGGSSAMPEPLRSSYTEGERSVLCVVAGEVKRHGICDLSIDEIADRAGVGRTTVQNSLHEARRLAHVKITERPVRGSKSLTNVVEIVSPEWKAWIRRAPSAARLIGSNLFKNASTSKIIDSRKKEAWQEKGPSSGPIRTRVTNGSQMDPLVLSRYA